jgi:hypothetical protein
MIFRYIMVYLGQIMSNPANMLGTSRDHIIFLPSWSWMENLAVRIHTYPATCQPQSGILRPYPSILGIFCHCSMGPMTRDGNVHRERSPQWKREAGASQAPHPHRLVGQHLVHHCIYPCLGLRKCSRNQKRWGENTAMPLMNTILSPAGFQNI